MTSSCTLYLADIRNNLLRFINQTRRFKIWFSVCALDEFLQTNKCTVTSTLTNTLICQTPSEFQPNTYKNEKFCPAVAPATNSAVSLVLISASGHIIWISRAVLWLCSFSSRLCSTLVLPKKQPCIWGRDHSCHAAERCILLVLPMKKERV